MKKVLCLFLLLSIALMLAGNVEYYKGQFSAIDKSRQLTVISHTPSSSTINYQPFDEIALTFSRNILPIEHVNDLDVHFSISPPLKGHFRARGTQTIVYVLDETPDPSSEYICTFRKGIMSVDSHVLVSDYSFTIKPLLLKVLGHNLKYEQFPNDTAIFMTFNYEIPMNELKAALSISSTHSKKNINYSVYRHEGETPYIYMDDKTKKYAFSVKIELRDTLDIETSYTLHFKHPELMNSAYYYTFKTFNRFRYFGNIELKNINYSSETGFDLIFSNRVNAQDLISNAYFYDRETGEKEKLPLRYGYRYFSKSFYLYREFKPLTTYYIKIEPGLKDIFGNPIENPGIYSITTGDYYPFIGFNDYYIYTVDDPIVNIEGMNWNYTDVLIDFLSIDNFINHYTNDPVYRLKSIFKSYQGKRYEFPSARNILHNLNININSDYKGNGWLGRGIVRYYQFYSSYTDTIDMPFIFQQSASALHMLLCPGNGIIWSADRMNGRMTGHGKTIVFDSDNRQIGRFSLKDGLYDIQKRDMKTFETDYEKPKFLYCMLTDQNNIMPYYYMKPQKKTVSFTFKDRDLYTLNDTVRISGIIRSKQANRISLPDFSEMKFTLQGPDYSVIEEGKVFIDKQGTFYVEFFIPDSFKTGYYYCYFDRNIYTSFNVQEFRTPKFKTMIETEKQVYKKDERARILIEGEYLTGQSMSKDSFEILFSSYRTAFSSVKTPGLNYNIINDDSYEYMPYDTFFGALDSEGKYSYAYRPIMSKIKNPLVFTATGTVKSIDKETVSANTGFRFMPRDEYAGLKLEKSHEDTFSLLWTVMNADEQFASNRKASITVISADNYDLFNPDTVFNKTLKSEKGIDTLKFIYNRMKYYKAVLEFDDCRVESHLYSYYYSSNIEDTSPFFITDKDMYAIGETAHIKIIPPKMDGRIMVFWGTDSIYGYTFEDLDTDTIYKDIKVLDDFVSGFYIGSVTMSENSSNDHSLKNHFVNVSNKSKEIQCSIESEEEYQPGDSVIIQINTDSDKDVHAVVSVVDESVLMLTNYAWGSPLSVFHSSYSCEFEYYSTYAISDYNYGYRNGYDYYGNGLMERTKKASAPGMEEEVTQSSMADEQSLDMEAAAGGDALPPMPQIRSDFRKTAFYAEKTVLAKGNGSVSFKLPDNTTKYRVSVIVLADDMFGKTQKQFTAKKKIMIEETLPMFLRPFDRLRLSFAVIDETGNAGMITGGIYQSDLNLIDDSIADMKPLNGKCEFRFDASAEFADTVSVTLFAAKGADNDFLRKEIPVITHNLYEYFATFNSTADTAVEAIHIDENTVRAGSEITISMNSSQIAQIKLPLEYLEDYPYLCLEQRLSRILPFVVGEELINTYNMSDIKGGKLRAYVDNVISEVKDYQASNGGFKYYRDSYYTSEYLSIYAMYVLYYAKQNNYKIPEEVIKRGLSYIERIVYSQFESIWDYSSYARTSLRCNALYVLSLFGRTDYKEPLNEVFENRDFLYMSSRGRLLETLINYEMKEKAATVYSELLSSVRIEATYAYFDDGRSDWWMFQNELKNTAVVLRALISYNSEFEYADKVTNFFAQRIKEGMWVNTHTTALVLESLQRYFMAFEKEYPDFNAVLNLNGRDIGKTHFKGRNDKIETSKITAYELNEGKNMLKLIMAGQGRLFYTLRFKYARKGKIEPLFNGFTVNKDIYDLKGNKVTEFRRGEFYEVVITVKTNKSRTFVTIDDPLPAGFDIVKRGFATEKLNLTGSNYNKNWWGGFYHEEFYKDRAVASATYLYKGEHRYAYYVKAFVSGEFTMPPTNVFEMYTPEVFGHSGSSIVHIE